MSTVFSGIADIQRSCSAERSLSWQQTMTRKTWHDSVLQLSIAIHIFVNISSPSQRHQLYVCRITESAVHYSSLLRDRQSLAGFWFVHAVKHRRTNGLLCTCTEIDFRCVKVWSAWQLHLKVIYYVLMMFFQLQTSPWSGPLNDENKPKSLSSW